MMGMDFPDDAIIEEGRFVPVEPYRRDAAQQADKTDFDDDDLFKQTWWEWFTDGLSKYRLLDTLLLAIIVLFVYNCLSYHRRDSHSA